MNHLSSLPLKKRPLRHDFTSIEDLAVPHSRSFLMSDNEITSSERSSPASSTGKESELSNQHPFSPNQPFSTIYTPQPPFAFIHDPNNLKQTSEYNCFELNQRFNSTNIYPHPCKNQLINRAKYQAQIRRQNSKSSGRYKCAECGKRFVQNSSLVTHFRIHTGERPFKCTFLTCNEAFTDYSTYTKHIRTHTGERPYSCPICFRKFSQSGNMHRHLKGVHKQIALTKLIKTT